jgi:hypothetical protein
MRINNVDFPEPLFEAQKNGALVVFAGAGVSIPPPSNFPNFDSLAEQVAAGVLNREKDEPVDRFLGRLKDRHVEVHDIVRRILSDPTSKPNALHTALLRLFESATKVRVVTTNFDLHFTSAATAIFSNVDNLEVYSAPALPRGSSFSGIVHLHGTVAKPADRLVLTDSDFGIAYLTDGWATRFLQQLFAENLVLFVGYSHNDTVIDYLARGLPPKSKGPGRFAFTVEGTDAHWKRLGITPVTYPVGAEGARHSALAPALKSWVDRIWTATLDHEDRIKSIVKRSLSLDPEELDYIEGSCKDLSLARFFTRHASSPDWLRWAESKGVLSSLFKQTPVCGEVDQEFALWFARRFACSELGDALAVLQRQGGFIAPLLWYQLAWAFHAERPAHRVIARWVPLLVDSQPSQGSKNFLDYMLCACELPRDEATLLLLFEHLTRPSVDLRRSIWPSAGEGEEDVDIEIRTEGSGYWLNEAWHKLLEPNLATLADKLLLIATSNIQHAYSLLRSFGKDHANWDPLSTSCVLVEATGQGGPHDDGIKLLINIARDVLRWTIKSSTVRADFFIDIWFLSGYRLLRRLAIFGVAESAHRSSDLRVNWLLENDLIYAYGYKPEVFRVFQKSYATASESIRIKVLEIATQGSALLEGRTKDYEIFNLLNWLSKAAPDCQHTKKRFDKFAALHPDFGPREHPDLDSWIGPSGWGGPTSPLQTDEILSLSPERFLLELAAAKSDGFTEPSREGLLHGVSEAVTRQYGWSADLVRALKEKEFWEPDVWQAIVNGWRHSDLTDEQWGEVLTILLETSQIRSAITYEACKVLESGVGKPSHPIPTNSLALSIRVGEKFWDSCSSSDKERQDAVQDWLQVAINEPAGDLMMFWLRILSRLKGTVGQDWNGIPQEYKQFLDSVLDGNSYAAGIGRVLIASHLPFLFSLDREWTIQNVLPPLKLTENLARAVQAWHGLLWGTWTEDLLPYLLPYYEGAFVKLHSEFGKEQRKQFCAHLAGIACHSSINPIQQGWLNKFLLSVTVEERAVWASYMLQGLKGMKEIALEKAWNNWIDAYWQNRIDGIPVPLEASETAEMVGWSICFRKSFAEVAERVYKSPTPKSEHAFLFYDLSASDLSNRAPDAVAQFVLYLLKNRIEPIYDFDQIVKIVETLKQSTEARDHLLQICQQLAELGYPAAGTLKNSILANGQP